MEPPSTSTDEQLSLSPRIDGLRPASNRSQNREWLFKLMEGSLDAVFMFVLVFMVILISKYYDNI